MLGCLMILWILVMLPMCHDWDLSAFGVWLSIPLAVGVAYSGRVIRTYLIKRRNPNA